MARRAWHRVGLAVALVVLMASPLGDLGRTGASGAATAPSPDAAPVLAGERVAAAAQALATGEGPALGHPTRCTPTTGGSERCGAVAPATAVADWTNLTTGSVPSAGAGGWAMTYDSEDGYVLLYTGWATWNYSDGLWTNLSASGSPQPVQRSEPGLADDPAADYVLLWGGGFGQAAGCGSATGVCNDSWAFLHGRWAQLDPTCRASSGVKISCAALLGAKAPLLSYDAASRAVLLVAAGSGDSPGPGTWTFANTTWTDWNQNPGGQAQATPALGSLAYDAADGYTVGFGTPGTNAFQRGNQSQAITYKWANGSWTNLTPLLTGAPSARYDPGLTYDSTDGYLVLAGGWVLSCRTWTSPGAGASCANGTVAMLDDTWRYVGGAWTNVTAVGAPPGVAGNTLVDDHAMGSVLRLAGASFGCSSNPCYLSRLPVGPLPEVWAWGTTPPIVGLTTTISNPAPDRAQAVWFNASFLGGTPPIADTWQFGDGASASTPDAAHAYSAGGSFVAGFWANDSAGHRVHAKVQVEVQGNLTAGISATPSTTDQGVPVGFTSTVAGGTAPYSYSWTFGDGGRSTLADPSHTFTLIGIYGIRVWINDSAGAGLNLSTVVKVDPSLTVLSVFASPSPAELGAPVQFQANVSGGTLPYTLSWSFGDGGIGGNLANITHLYTTDGPFIATVSAVDSAGAVALGSVNVTIALSANASSNASLGAAPLPVAFLSRVGGGTPGYSYAWVFGDGATSLAANPQHTYATPGTYSAGLQVTDARGRSVMTRVPVLVAPGGGPLALAITPSEGSIVLGASAVLTAQPSGGFGRYSLEWTALPPGCSVQGPTTVQCVPPTSGSYEVNATLTDSAGHTVLAGALLQVGVTGPPASGPTSQSAVAGLGGPVVLLILVAAIALVVAAGVGAQRARVGSAATPRPGPEDRYAPYRLDRETPAARPSPNPPAASDPLDDLF